MGKRDDQLARLRADQDSWALAMKTHKRQCASCAAALRVGDTRRLCDYGWDVLSRQTVAKHALRNYADAADAAAAGQLELFNLPG